MSEEIQHPGAPCPKCKHGYAEFLGFTGDYVVLLCFECDHHWLEPIPKPEELGDWPSAIRFGSDL